jgi:hypothetical protein
VAAKRSEIKRNEGEASGFVWLRFGDNLRRKRRLEISPLRGISTPRAPFRFSSRKIADSGAEAARRSAD